MNHRQRPYEQGSACTASLGSVTVAMKAKRALSASQIKCEVVKVSTRRSAGGCVYGIEYPCELSGNVKNILDRAGVQIQAYNQ